MKRLWWRIAAVIGTFCLLNPTPRVSAAAPQAEPIGLMFWTFRNEGVYAATRFIDDISNVKLVVKAAGAVSLAVDNDAGKLYFMVSDFPKRNSDKLLRARLDGTQVEEIAAGLDFTGDLALDSKHHKLYITNIGRGTLTRMDIDGKNPQDIVNGQKNPDEMAIDAKHSKLYWAADTKIRRANLDGTQAEDVADTKRGTMGLALDVDREFLYYAIATEGTIRRVRFDGTGGETVVKGLTGVDGVALDTDHGKLYWTEAGKISQSNLTGGERDDLFGGKTHKWASLVVTPPPAGESAK